MLSNSIADSKRSEVISFCELAVRMKGVRSLFELVVVSPLGLSSEDASIGDGIFEVGSQLQELVGRPELAPVVTRAVADDDLGGVLVGHDDRGLGQPRPEGQRVVALKGLLHHAGVQVVALLVDCPK